MFWKGRESDWLGHPLKPGLPGLEHLAFASSCPLPHAVALQQLDTAKLLREVTVLGRLGFHSAAPLPRPLLSRLLNGANPLFHHH